MPNRAYIKKIEEKRKEKRDQKVFMAQARKQQGQNRETR